MALQVKLCRPVPSCPLRRYTSADLAIYSIMLSPTMIVGCFVCGESAAGVSMQRAGSGAGVMLRVGWGGGGSWVGVGVGRPAKGSWLAGGLAGHISPQPGLKAAQRGLGIPRRAQRRCLTCPPRGLHASRPVRGLHAGFVMRRWGRPPGIFLCGLFNIIGAVVQISRWPTIWIASSPAAPATLHRTQPKPSTQPCSRPRPAIPNCKQPGCPSNASTQPCSRRCPTLPAYWL
jgi:hypothetical protein